jgi:hypothetical protein
MSSYGSSPKGLMSRNRPALFTWKKTRKRIRAQGYCWACSRGRLDLQPQIHIQITKIGFSFEIQPSAEEAGTSESCLRVPA